MPPRDFTSQPISDQLGLPNIIAGLVGDLESLRAGQITVGDALARAQIAKQIFNGVRLYMNGTKLVLAQAKKVPSADAIQHEGPGQ